MSNLWDMAPSLAPDNSSNAARAHTVSGCEVSVGCAGLSRNTDFHNILLSDQSGVVPRPELLTAGGNHVGGILRLIAKGKMGWIYTGGRAAPWAFVKNMFLGGERPSEVQFHRNTRGDTSPATATATESVTAFVSEPRPKPAGIGTAASVNAHPEASILGGAVPVAGLATEFAAGAGRGVPGLAASGTNAVGDVSLGGHRLTPSGGVTPPAVDSSAGVSRCVNYTRAVSISMLAYNEEANLTGAAHDVMTAARDAGLDQWEIIIVDDGSTDGTGQIADALAAQYECIRVAHHPQNRGLRAGYETGLARSRLSHSVWLPADGEMATASIAAILRAVGTADLVVPYHGTPERRTWFRRLLTWGSTTQLNLLLGHGLHYYQGTVVYPTDLARRLPRTESGFFFCAEMLAHALDGWVTYVEVPLTHTDRAHGVSKAVSLRAIWRAQMLILRLHYRLRLKPLCEALSYALAHGV